MNKSATYRGNNDPETEISKVRKWDQLISGYIRKQKEKGTAQGARSLEF